MNKFLLAAVLLVGLVPAPAAHADITDIPEALLSYMLDDAALTVDNALFAVAYPGQYCEIQGRGNGSPAGHTPYGDIIFGNDIIIATATCPNLPSVIELKVWVEYYAGRGRWEPHGPASLCDNLVWPNPTTTPPCLLVNNMDPGPKPAPGQSGPDWLYKCRRGVAQLIQPATGQPRKLLGVWGCSTTVESDFWQEQPPYEANLLP